MVRILGDETRKRAEGEEKGGVLVGKGGDGTWRVE